MKVLTVAALVSLGPTIVLGLGCNADNVLRALRANSAKASPFCSTYTRPPPNQPLPTYVSQYPASRVTSACSCFITATSTKSSTSSTTSPSSTPTPTPYDCETDAITNGDFNLQANGKADPWVAAPPSNANGQSTSAGFGNGYAYLSVNNGQTGGNSGTYIKQTIPPLCYGVEFNLTYTSQVSISGGQPYHGCRIYYSLDSIGQLVFSGPPNGDLPPFQIETRHYVFTYYGNSGGEDTLRIDFSCNTPGGSYTVYDVSLVGYNHD